MKNYILIICLLTFGCGKEEDIKVDNSNPDVVSEVDVIATPKINTTNYLKPVAIIFMNFTTLGDTTYDHHVAAYNSNGEVPPDCKQAEFFETSSLSFVSISDLKTEVKYGMRICMVNSAGKYSTGKTISFTTPAPE